MIDSTQSSSGANSGGDRTGLSSKTINFLIAAGMLAIFIVCWASWRGAEVRYRVSYTLDDNGVMRSASAVWSNAIWPALIPLVNKYNGDFHGEAIPLRLPGRGVLLLTPLGDAGQGVIAGRMVRQLFSHRASASDDDRVGNTAEVARMVGQSRPIRCAQYAILQPRREPGEVTYNDCLNFIFVSNPKDQSTLRRIEVDDGKFENLKGVRLTDARVTITRDPVTRGLERLLPWLPAAQKYWTNKLITNEDDVLYAPEIIYMRS